MNTVKTTAALAALALLLGIGLPGFAGVKELELDTPVNERKEQASTSRPAGNQKQAARSSTRKRKEATPRDSHSEDTRASVKTPTLSAADKAYAISFVKDHPRSSISESSRAREHAFWSMKLYVKELDIELFYCLKTGLWFRYDDKARCFRPYCSILVRKNDRTGETTWTLQPVPGQGGKATVLSSREGSKNESFILTHLSPSAQESAMFATK
jgi:hypothetical protein